MPNMKPATFAASAIYSLLAASLPALEIKVTPEQSLEQTLRDLSARLKKTGVPQDGLTVTVQAGDYFIKNPIVLGSEFKGTKDRPIVIRAAGEGEVWVNGTRTLSPESFIAVSNPADRARLAVSAADHIRVATVTDPEIHRVLSRRLMQNLILDGQSFSPSVFPNSGYAKLKSKAIAPEVSPPGISPENVGYGVRAGRPPQQEPGKNFGWRGDLKNPRGAQVGFATHEDEMAGTWAQWEAELKRDNSRNSLTGFIEANWLLSSQQIYAASANDRAIHLSRALQYGWKWKQNDKPFRVFGLLCELDQPGEWHYDREAKKLYLYPISPLTAKSTVGVALASGFLHLKGTSYLHVIGLNARNFGNGSVYALAGSHNLLADATIRNSTATGVSVGGHDNTARDLDLIDLNRHVNLSGGKRSSNEITAGRNTVANCHIYQKNVKHLKVNIALSGVGNAFRNNLVHNSIGQAMVIRGNDHLIELNEFFNIGYEEGDGGAMYAGGDLTGYGVHYRHNFFHHLMHVPGKVERSGIHLDDLQAGSICTGNVFYKSAAKGIHMNGGAGHTLSDNVFLEGNLGIYNVGHGGKKNYDRQLRISADAKAPERFTKEDYVGRAERLVGRNGWNKEPWKSKYPVFRQVMNDTGENGRLWPIRCTAENNFYHANRYNRTIFSRCSPEVMSKVSLKEDRAVEPSDFANYHAMDFRFTGGAGKAFPAIPFTKIGLQLEGHRDSMPQKAHYRTKVKEFFKGIKSMPGTKKQINTAVLVENGPVTSR